MTYTQARATADDVWHPWVTNYATIASEIEGITDVSYPQPLIGDIEFSADGNMILSLLDRSSFQFGYAAPAPGGLSGDTVIEYFSAGDLLRATFSGGTYTLETTEFYDDQWAPSGNPLSGNNDDTGTGGAAFAPGLNVLIQGLSDAVDTFSAGIGFFNPADGSELAAQEVFQGSDQPSSPYFAKAGGLGDIELLCSPATYYVEIGNRVWIDSDNDGVQDAGEGPLANVTVELVAPDGTVLATAVTDAEGNYYFSSAPGTSTGSHQYGIAGLTANTNSFIIRINTSQAALTAYGPTTPNNDGSANGDARDSDGQVVGSYSQVTFNTGDAGDNDFSFDFGFNPAGPTAVTLASGSGAGLFQSPIALASILVGILVVAFVVIGGRARGILKR